MTETVGLIDESAAAPVATEPAPPRSSRLFQAAAWVAIVAGTLFIVATVFFAGFFMGRHSGDHGYGHGGGHHSRSMPGGFGGPGMMPPWGPGQMGPGMGQLGPGGPGGPGAGGPNAGNAAPSPSAVPPRP